HVLETVPDVGVATALVPEHLEASTEPLVRRLLDVLNRDVAIPARGGLHPAPEWDHARGEMKGFLAEHRRHARGVRLVGGNLLHGELVLPHPVDESGELDVVEEAVVLEVECSEDVRAG